MPQFQLPQMPPASSITRIANMFAIQSQRGKEAVSRHTQSCPTGMLKEICAMFHRHVIPMSEAVLLDARYKLDRKYYEWLKGHDPSKFPGETDEERAFQQKIALDISQNCGDKPDSIGGRRGRYYVECFMSRVAEARRIIAHAKQEYDRARADGLRQTFRDRQALAVKDVLARNAGMSVQQFDQEQRRQERLRDEARRRLGLPALNPPAGEPKFPENAPPGVDVHSLSVRQRLEKLRANPLTEPLCEKHPKLWFCKTAIPLKDVPAAHKALLGMVVGDPTVKFAQVRAQALLDEEAIRRQVEKERIQSDIADSVVRSKRPAGDRSVQEQANRERRMQGFRGIGLS